MRQTGLQCLLVKARPMPIRLTSGLASGTALSVSPTSTTYVTEADIAPLRQPKSGEGLNNAHSTRRLRRVRQFTALLAPKQATNTRFGYRSDEVMRDTGVSGDPEIRARITKQ